MLGLAVACLPLLVNANQFRPAVESQLSKTLGRTVTIGDLKLALMAGGVTASDLAIADDPAYSRQPFLRAKQLHLGVEWRPLLTARKLNVTELVLDSPDIELVESESGRWNYSSLGAAGAKDASSTGSESGGKMDLSIRLTQVKDGRVTVMTPASKQARVFDHVNAEVRDLSTVSAIPFTLSLRSFGDAAVNASGTVGPLNVADAAETPFRAKIDIGNLDLQSSGLLNPSLGVAGLTAIALDGAFDGHKLEARGQVKAERLKLARTGSPASRLVEFDFASVHDIKKRTGYLSSGEIHAGKAVAHLTGHYALHGETAVLNMKLLGQSMAIEELQALLPSLGIVLPAGSALRGGTAQADLRVEGPTSRLNFAGTVGLSRTVLHGFDLGSGLKRVAALTGIQTSPDTEIERLSARVQSDPQTTSISDLLLIAPPIGELSGSGTVDSRKNLDFSVRANLHTAGVLMSAIGQKGDTSIPFFIRGTASAPNFVPDTKTLAREKIDSLIRHNDPNKTIDTVRGILDSFRKK